MKKKNKPLSKTALKKLIAKLDRKATKVFNQYIRTEAKIRLKICPLCRVNPIQCCFHIVTANRKSTRYNELNVIGACTACNYVENYWSDLSRAWYIQTFGVEQYLALVEESKKDFEFTVEYLQNIICTYQEKLSNLPTPSKV